MGIAVNSYGMTFVDHPLHQILVAVGIADNKEGSLHVVGFQDVQHLRRNIGVGAIVKGKIDPIIRVGFVGVNLDGTLNLRAVAAAVADRVGQSICTDRRSIHAAADFDSRSQVAIHIVTGAVAGILEAAAHGNIDRGSALQGNGGRHHITDQQAALSRRHVAGGIGHRIGQGNIFAFCRVLFRLGNDHIGGQITVTAIHSRKAGFFIELPCRDPHLRIAGQFQSGRLPVHHGNRPLHRIGFSLYIDCVSDGIVSGDSRIHSTVHHHLIQQVRFTLPGHNTGIFVVAMGIDHHRFLTVQPKLHRGSQHKIAFLHAQQSHDQCRHQHSADGGPHNDFLIHNDPPLIVFFSIIKDCRAVSRKEE